MCCNLGIFSVICPRAGVIITLSNGAVSSVSRIRLGDAAWRRDPASWSWRPSLKRGHIWGLCRVGMCGDSLWKRKG
jgi:hypothetical protein